ncbi:hypothetical protein TWF191_001665 [Orbilia oligospora]|uniref:Uncharacterized protein n=1 Tax=Orbilia oligospora TaxID=2813651 RepID=A0A7C8R059_ORBOL|nr:hypothetical protein TWF191_001665 [Orbilia oligospora]
MPDPDPAGPMSTPATTEYLGPEEDTFSGINNSPEPKLKILTGNDAPWPGSSYIIGYQNTSKVLTYKDGDVVLAEYEGKPTQRWACHARDGWLGFANDPGETTLWLGIGEDERTDPPKVEADRNRAGWESVGQSKLGSLVGIHEDILEV